MTSEPVFGSSTFAQAFPEIETLHIKCIQDPEFVEDWRRESSCWFRPDDDNTRNPIECGNKWCRGQGFDWEYLLREVRDAREMKRVARIRCRGIEKGAGRRKCYNHADLTITVTYKGTP